MLRIHWSAAIGIEGSVAALGREERLSRLARVLPAFADPGQLKPFRA